MLGALVLIGAVYVVGFGGNTSGPADNSGYLNAAKMLARGRLAELIRPIRGLDVNTYPAMGFCPVGHRPGQKPGTIVPVYPVGFPLHIALASLAVGLDRAVIVVNFIAWLAVAPALYLLGRRLELPPAWSLVALGLFMCFPVTMLHYTRVMSDGLATTWAVLAFLAALESRQRPWVAVLAGVALSVAVLIRPTNVLLAPGLLLAVGWRVRALGWFAAGAAPLGVALGAYNFILYGEVLTTGYSGMGSNFELANLWPCLSFYGGTLLRYLSPVFLVLLLAAVWFALGGDRRQWVLLAWGGAVVGLYMLYEHSLTGSWWRLRFVLPALPALLLSAVLAARELAGKALARWGEQRRVRSAVTAVLLVSLVWPIGSSLQQIVSERIWNGGRIDEFYQRSVEWMEAQVEPNAVIMAMGLGGTVYHYTNHPVLRWDIIGPREFQRFRAEAAAKGVPVYSLLGGGELKAHGLRYPRMFSRVGERFGVSLWRLKRVAGAEPVS